MITRLKARKMDDVPIDCVAHILSFLPLRQVFVCKSVCRTFKFAAEFAIQDCEKLMLTDIVMVDIGYDEQELEYFALPLKAELSLTGDDFSPDLQAHHDQVTEAMWTQRLEGFQSLKTFVVHESEVPHSVCQQVMRRSDSTLKYIDICKPDEEDGLAKLQGVYTKLQELLCLGLDSESAAACTHLVELDAMYLPTSSIALLPSDTMRSLIAYVVYEMDPNVRCSVTQMVTSLSRLNQLTNLNLGDVSFPGNGPEATLADQTLSRLVHSLRNLNSLRIFFSNDGDMHEEEYVPLEMTFKSLLLNCRSLQSLVLIYIGINDAVVDSLSKMTSLQSIFLRIKTGCFTTERLLKILRGGSRHCLQNIEMFQQILGNGVRKTSIRKELRTIARQRGCRFNLKLESGRRTRFPRQEKIRISFKGLYDEDSD